MNLYFISGIGADKRVFARLQLPSSYTIHHLDWIPFQPSESLPQYALRMAKAIDVTRPFSLIGLSFGGMLASEIARVLQPNKTIIISSAGSSSQLPPYLSLFRYTGLYKIAPYQLFKKPNAFFHWLFGVKGKEEKMLFNQILKDADNKILKNSIRAILTWENKKVAPHVYHIHGGQDRILPLRFVRSNYIIKDGGHFMVYTHAAQISKVLTQVLST